MSLGAATQRKDGRAATQLRSKELRTATLSQYDGSAWYAQGQSTVVAAVNGPMGAKPEQEDYRRCVFEVAVTRTSSLPIAGGASRGLVQAKKTQRDDQDAELEHYITNCLQVLVLADAFPRCVIQVTLDVLKDDGSLMAVAVNATMCALLDAAIPCRTTIAAVSLLVLAPTLVPNAPASSSTSGGSGKVSMLLDPTKEEEERQPHVAQSTLVFALPQSGGGVVASKTVVPPAPDAAAAAPAGALPRLRGGVSIADMALVEAVGERAAKVMFEFFRNCSVALPEEETAASL